MKIRRRVTAKNFCTKFSPRAGNFRHKFPLPPLDVWKYAGGSQPKISAQNFLRERVKFGINSRSLPLTYGNTPSPHKRQFLHEIPTLLAADFGIGRASFTRDVRNFSMPTAALMAQKRQRTRFSVFFSYPKIGSEQNSATGASMPSVSKTRISFSPSRRKGAGT